jgi:hypothetical protein
LKGNDHARLRVIFVNERGYSHNPLRTPSSPIGIGIATSMAGARSTDTPTRGRSTSWSCSCSVGRTPREANSDREV